MRVPNWCLIKALVQIIVASVIRDAINQQAEWKPVAPWRHPSRHLARRQSGISLRRRSLFCMLCCRTRRRRGGRLTTLAHVNVAFERWSLKFGLDPGLLLVNLGLMVWDPQNVFLSSCYFTFLVLRQSYCLGFGLEQPVAALIAVRLKDLLEATLDHEPGSEVWVPGVDLQHFNILYGETLRQ